MLTPEYLSRVAEGSEDISSQLHEYIIRQIIQRIMLRIGRGEEYIFTSSDRWRIKILQDAGYLLEDITAEVAKYTRLQRDEIKAAMEDAGIHSISYDNAIYEAAGLPLAGLMQSPALIKIIERDYNATLGEWRNMTRSTAEAAQRLFINESDMAYHKVISGAVSYTQAVREAVDSIVSDGVKIKYPSGREVAIEPATAMVVRTGVSQAAADIALRRAFEMGWNKVLTSSHMGARPTHEVWQGQVHSVDWSEMRRIRPDLFEGLDSAESAPAPDPRYPDFIKTCEYGDVAGICGANCRHNFSAWTDGMGNPFEHYNSEENRKLYKNQQHQRLLERRIRKTKREVMGMQEAVKDCQDDKARAEIQKRLDRKSHLLGEQNKAYREFCKENNLRPLSDRLYIAKWSRLQAAKAIGAARRYENAKK